MSTQIREPRANGALFRRSQYQPPEPWYRRRIVLIAAAGVLLMVIVLGGLARIATRATLPAEAPPMTVRAPVVLVAHGALQPARNARVRTLGGGVVRTLPFSVGDEVADRQPLAVIQGVNGAEILTAPFGGTVTETQVHLGDTVLAGATIASVGTLSDYEIQTTDVDQYLVARIRPGQTVSVQIDALPQSPLVGSVRTVAVEPVTNAAGVQSYTVTVALPGAPFALRPGMLARVEFKP